jgi:ribosome modulation factor
LTKGFDAFLPGVPRHACPYRPSTQEYYDWLLGWDEAEEADFEEEKNA